MELSFDFKIPAFRCHIFEKGYPVLADEISPHIYFGKNTPIAEIDSNDIVVFRASGQIKLHD